MPFTLSCFTISRSSGRMGFGAIRTLKPSASEGAVLCDVGGHVEEAGVTG